MKCGIKHWEEVEDACSVLRKREEVYLVFKYHKFQDWAVSP